MGLAGVLSMSVLLTGCGSKKKDNEVVMTEDDKSARDVLLQSFDAMAESGNVRLSMKNDYELKMRTTSSGIQMDVVVDSNYTNNLLLLKGQGFGMNVENDYTIDVKSVSTSTNYNDSSTSKNAFVAFYDETNDTYYYTLGNENNVTWYRTAWDGDQMGRDFYAAIKTADVNYTMESTTSEYKITFDYASLSESSEMQSFFAKYSEAMGTIDEYFDILGTAQNGMATFVINKSTNLLSDFTVTGISLSNAESHNMVGDSDSDDMIIGDMSIAANINVSFGSYGKVTEDDITSYRDRVSNSVDASEADSDSSSNTKTQVDGDTVFYYEDESLTDTHNVAKYDLVDITNDDLNNVRFAPNTDYETLYIKPNRVTNYGWEYQTPSNDEENPAVTFLHSKYPNAMFTLIKRSDSETYSDMIDKGAIGYEINVLNSAIAKTAIPDMSFTDFNIKFGMSEDDVLDKLGKPDVVYIGQYYTQYQYSTYSLAESGAIDTVSVVFTFYHVDDVNGMYDVDMERYSGSAKQNVGNKDVDATGNVTDKSEDK